MKQTALTALPFLVLFLLAWWNAEVIKWKHGSLNSDRWHAIGAVVRGALAAMVFLVAGFWWSAAFLVLALVGYNAIINCQLKQPLFYLGKTAKTDLFLRWFINTFYRGYLRFFGHWTCLRGGPTISASMIALAAAMYFFDDTPEIITGQNAWKLFGAAYIIASFFWTKAYKIP